MDLSSSRRAIQNSGRKETNARAAEWAGNRNAERGRFMYRSTRAKIGRSLSLWCMQLEYTRALLNCLLTESCRAKTKVAALSWLYIIWRWAGIIRVMHGGPLRNLITIKYVHSVTRWKTMCCGNEIWGVSVASKHRWGRFKRLKQCLSNMFDK